MELLRAFCEKKKKKEEDLPKRIIFYKYNLFLICHAKFDLFVIILYGSILLVEIVSIRDGYRCGLEGNPHPPPPRPKFKIYIYISILIGSNFVQ